MRQRQPKISTVHLGQFTRETANAIAGRLEKAGIVWWYKEPGFMSQVWEFGVRLYVDRERLPEAERIAERVVARRERIRRDREKAALEPERGGPVATSDSRPPGTGSATSGPPPVPPPPPPPPDTEPPAATQA